MRNGWLKFDFRNSLLDTTRLQVVFPESTGAPPATWHGQTYAENVCESRRGKNGKNGKNRSERQIEMDMRWKFMDGQRHGLIQGKSVF